MRLVKLAECHDFAALLSKFGTGPVAFDLETSGLEPLAEGAYIRSIALFNDSYSVAIDLEGAGEKSLALLYDWLHNRKTVAHNWTFDAAWVESKGYGMPGYEMCTKAMFMYLSNEGYHDQQWGLKHAEVEILGWPESNEKGLYKWLADNKLTASQMSRAPWYILGPYNFRDAEATWLLYKYFVKFYDRFPALREYMAEDVAMISELLVEQKLTGMCIDIPKATTFHHTMDTQIAEELARFLAHPSVAPHVAEFNEAVVRQVLEAEPPKVTKAGKTSERWLQWQAKAERVGSEMHFNTDSPKQLQWLFFQQMGCKPARLTPKGEPSVDAKSLRDFGEPGKILLRYRELRDEQKFVSSLLEVGKTGMYHPWFKMPATVTGRLGGGHG